MIINYIITKLGNTTHFIPPTFILKYAKSCPPPPKDVCAPSRKDASPRPLKDVCPPPPKGVCPPPLKNASPRPLKDVCPPPPKGVCPPPLKDASPRPLKDLCPPPPKGVCPPPLKDASPRPLKDVCPPPPKGVCPPPLKDVSPPPLKDVCPPPPKCVCPPPTQGTTGSGPTGSGTKMSGTGSQLKRAINSAPVRLGFLPEEWFRFFHGKTGVSGPYIFGIALSNYLLSKEIFVMEHEYYVGLSIFVILYYVTTTFGKSIGSFLDKDVDRYVNEMEKIRKDERSVFENEIKEAELDQFRAQGQKMLIEAKKENIAMQLEAAYRERLMHVLKLVKGRMDYQVKLHQANNRIQQKWMIGWIIREVNKSLTPEFEKLVFDSAIQQIAAAASKVK